MPEFQDWYKDQVRHYIQEIEQFAQRVWKQGSQVLNPIRYDAGFLASNLYF